MNKYLRGASAAAILVLASGIAYAAPGGSTTVSNGYVGLGFDYTSSSTDQNYTESWNYCGDEGGTCNDEYKYHFTTHTPAFTVEAKAALPVTDLIGLQFDLGYGYYRPSTHETETWSDGSTHAYAYESSNNNFDGTVHAFARTNQWLAGVFLGGETTGGFQLLGGGVEGQYYAGPVTVQGAVGAASMDFGNSYQCMGCRQPRPYAIAARLDARYFVTDDLSLAANVGYMHGAYDYAYGANSSESNSGRLWTVGVTGEYRFPHSPFAALVSYEHGDVSANYKYAWASGSEYDNEFDHIKASGDTVRVILRWTFGGSLRDRDRHGASLNSLRQLFGSEFVNNMFGQDYYGPD